MCRELAIMNFIGSFCDWCRKTKRKRKKTMNELFKLTMIHLLSMNGMIRWIDHYQ